jgi:endoglucanase
MLFRLALALLFSLLIPAGLSAKETPKAANADIADLETISSPEVVKRMGLGWNLGNTMEACGDWIKGNMVSKFETAWGNPETTKEMIDKIKESGFKSVRIPVAWSNLMGDNYTIDSSLLERVKQIADWVQEDGMIAVVNIHWDGGWWTKFPTEPEKTMKRYTRLWSQVAGYFKNEPGSLIFESLNEEGCFNDVWNRWGGAEPEKKKKAFDILNNINQTFVDLVRKSGGLNAKRHLLIAGYCTDIDMTVSPEFLMPKDPENHLILSVHYYTPYTFCGLEKDETWGKARPTWGTDADFDELNANMQKLKPRFLDAGIPVIMGEYGSTLKTKEIESVRLYILSVTEKVYSMGMCPMLWDPGTHFDRRTLEFKDPELLEGLQKIMGMNRDVAGAKGGAAETKRQDGAATCVFSIPEDVLKQAQETAASEEGRKYEKKFTASSAEHLEGFRRVCTIETPQKADLSFVLKIEKSGTVSEVYAGSEDPVAGCVARKLANEKCPRPPSAPYFELVELKTAK